MKIKVRVTNKSFPVIIGLILLCLFCFSFEGRAQKLNDQYFQVAQALQKNPNDIKLKLQLATLMTQGREFERALALYEELLANPNQSDANNEKMKQALITEACFVATQGFLNEKAETYCQKMIEFSEQKAFSYDNLGMSRLYRGRVFSAQEAFLQAVKENANFLTAKIHLAQGMQIQQQPDEAKKVLDAIHVEALETADKILYYHTLYLVMNDLKNYKLAKEAIDQARKLSHNDLYFGKYVLAFMKEHQIIVFIIFFTVWLMFCQYMGKRLNRFLKNEIA